MALVQREVSECKDGRSREREREKKNNHYPKTCSIMSETLFSPAKSLGALLRKYSDFVIEMWMADREEVTDLSKTEGVREKFWHLWEREVMHPRLTAQEHGSQHQAVHVYKPELNYGLNLLVLSYVALYWPLGWISATLWKSLERIVPPHIFVSIGLNMADLMSNVSTCTQL